MPRKKKITENVTPEKTESAVVSEVVESKPAEAKLEEASLEGLLAEKVEGAEKEVAVPKQRKPRAKRGTVKKDVEVKVKEVVTKRGAAKKEAVKKELGQEKQIYIQYANKEVNVADIEERVKKAWESEGHRAGSIKKLDIYIKPEEYAVYYVINGKNAGRVDF